MDYTITNDFRERFSKLADEALVTRSELAALLATTASGVSQMAYRGELPSRAFPEKRRACWFAKDIRIWLNNSSSSRGIVVKVPSRAPSAPIGRKRLPTDRI